jgi:hypothetical protein
MIEVSTDSSTQDAAVPRRWLPFVRIAWIILVLIYLAMFVAGIAPYFRELNTICAGDTCAPTAITPKEVASLNSVGLSAEHYAGFLSSLDVIYAILSTVLAGLIFWRRSDNWMGILVSLTLVAFATSFLSEADLALARLYPTLAPLNELLTSLSIILFILLFCLFPDGRFVPRWTRLLAILLVASTLIELLFAGGPILAPGQVSAFLIFAVLGGVVLGVYAQIFRYRRVSTPVQRQQTKWVVFGLAATLLPIFVWSLFVELFPLQPGTPRLLFFIIGLGSLLIVLTLFPLSVAISILRYRLWDIDIVINRALVYGLLTGGLALAYFGSVLLLQALFRTITGQADQLAIVLSTLAIAALFQPMRSRIQALIDRRFYRRKYNAEKTLAGFATTVRDEVDLERLSAELLRVVDETMQPDKVSLWLKKIDKRLP